MQILGYGILMWNSMERRSQRYGFIWMDESTFDEKTKRCPYLNNQLVDQFEGKKVRLSCRIKEARPSGHAGDAFIGIFPSMPEVDEIVELGVGDFTFIPENLSFCGISVGIRPPVKYQRQKYWIDPHKLYRVHDQTVELLIEETTDDYSPVPDIKILHDPSEAIVNADGTIQCLDIPCSENQEIYILPKIEKIGDGLFSISNPQLIPGQAVELKIRDKI